PSVATVCPNAAHILPKFLHRRAAGRAGRNRAGASPAYRALAPGFWSRSERGQSASLLTGRRVRGGGVNGGYVARPGPPPERAAIDSWVVRSIRCRCPKDRK